MMIRPRSFGVPVISLFSNSNRFYFYFLFHGEDYAPVMYDIGTTIH